MKRLNSGYDLAERFLGPFLNFSPFKHLTKKKLIKINEYFFKKSVGEICQQLGERFFQQTKIGPSDANYGQPVRHRRRDRPQQQNSETSQRAAQAEQTREAQAQPKRARGVMKNTYG